MAETMSDGEIPNIPRDAIDALYPPGGLLATLRVECSGWLAYVDHEFVRGLADGSLPEHCFRHFLVQDYLFLIHFARAYALAAYKGETLDDIGNAMRACSAIVDTEMALHVKFCDGWGITEAEMAATDEAAATMAYTRYVLERGLAGDLLDLHIALAPCVLGYAEIGLTLAQDPATKREGNPYADWIEMYAGEEYQDVAREAAAFIETLARRRGAEARLASLRKTFGEATRLEIAFWEQGLAASA
jgi:thiaminase/transcriptional activator TenA